MEFLMYPIILFHSQNFNFLIGHYNWIVTFLSLFIQNYNFFHNLFSSFITFHSVKCSIYQK